MHHHHHHREEPIVSNFTSVVECVDYIVPYILCKKVVIVHLNRLSTDHGIVITDMPIFRYPLEIDIDDKDKITLNALEFRDGKDYDYLTVNKLFGWVTSQNHGLGTLTSIDLTVTVFPCDPKHKEHGGEHYLQTLGSFYNCQHSNLNWNRSYQLKVFRQPS